MLAHVLLVTVLARDEEENVRWWRFHKRAGEYESTGHLRGHRYCDRRIPAIHNYSLADDQWTVNNLITQCRRFVRQICPPNFTQVPVPRNFPPETLLSPPYLPHLSRYLPHMSPYLPQSFGSGKLSHRVSLIDGAGTFRNSLSTKLRPSRPERHGQLTGQPVSRVCLRSRLAG